MCSHTWDTGATNQSYRRKSCSTAPLPESGCFRYRLSKTNCRSKVHKRSEEKSKEDREKERERGGNRGRVNKTPCGTSTTEVSRYSRDGEIGLKLKIELSSLLPRSFKFTLRTFHIPDSPRYVSFTFARGRRNDVFTFFRRMLKTLSTRKDRLWFLWCNLVESYSLRVFSFDHMTHHGDQNPFDGIFKSNRILLYLRIQSRLAKNFQWAKFTRISVRRRVRQYSLLDTERYFMLLLNVTFYIGGM